MAVIQRPQRSAGKGLPPSEIERSSNLAKSNDGDTIHLTFKVPKEFKKDFRGQAYEEEISMTDLLKKCFALYREAKGGGPQSILQRGGQF